MKDIIHALVYASDEFSAQIIAREVVNKKILHEERGLVYVSYVDEDGLKQLTRNKKIQFLPVLQVGTSLFPTEDNRGLKLVNSVIDANLRQFKRTMVYIRKLIEDYTDDELFGATYKGKGAEDPAYFRSLCSDASGNQGMDAKLYDLNGDAIWSPEHLQLLLNPSWESMLFFNEGGDPFWGDHIWTQPLWAVPFQRITVVSI